MRLGDVKEGETSSESAVRRILERPFRSTVRSESPEASFIKLTPVIVPLTAPRSSEVNNASTASRGT